MASRKKWCPTNLPWPTGASTDLVRIDPSFVVEQQFIQNHLAKSLQEAVEQEFLNCLPSSTRTVSLQQSLQKLEAYQESQACKVAGPESQRKGTAIADALKGMVNAAPPKYDLWQKDEYFNRVLQQFEWFLEVQPKQFKNGSAETLRGKRAFKRRLEWINENAEKSDTVQYKHFDEIFMFGWLLSADEMNVAKKLVDAILSRSATAAAQSSSSSSKGPKEPPAKAVMVKKSASGSSVRKYF